jgi:hypothetical protein
MYLPGLFTADLIQLIGPHLMMALGAPIITAGNAILYAGGTLRVRRGPRPPRGPLQAPPACRAGCLHALGCGAAQRLQGQYAEGGSGWSCWLGS